MESEIDFFPYIIIIEVTNQSVLDSSDITPCFLNFYNPRVNHFTRLLSDKVFSNLYLYIIVYFKLDLPICILFMDINYKLLLISLSKKPQAFNIIKIQKLTQ